MRTRILGGALLVWLSACFGAPDIDPDRPNPPATNDPAFTSEGLKSWYVVADGLQPGDNQMSFTITAPDDPSVVDAYIPGLAPVRMTKQADGHFKLDISIETVAIGSHDLLFSANGSGNAFAKFTFHRSAAYYVLVSTDYDFSDCGNGSLTYMDKLHADHPGMVMTHFWPPYTYTDSAVSPARRDELDAWIKKQRDMFKDEIGLHIHPYCNFVEAAGVTCITDQSTVSAEDLTGYTIKLSAYGVAPMSQLLQYADTLFNQRGLGSPRTFRAGGWTADINTLTALDANGYLADTSALNWKRIEEWNRYELFHWNMTNWTSIDDTSQPYYPSTTDPQRSTPGPNLQMLEVPDNGVMIDYLSIQEMNGIFDANFDGTPLGRPKTLMMGFHPATSFSEGEYSTVDAFLDYADTHLSSKGDGPVIYVTLSDVTKAGFSPQ